jgi:hypothetical protein
LEVDRLAVSTFCIHLNVKNHINPSMYLPNVSFKRLQRLEISFEKTDQDVANYGIKEIIDIFKAMEEPPQI